MFIFIFITAAALLEIVDLGVCLSVRYAHKYRSSAVNFTAQLLFRWWTNTSVARHTGIQSKANSSNRPSEFLETFANITELRKIVAII
jgi:hypothetical protein